MTGQEAPTDPLFEVRLANLVVEIATNDSVLAEGLRWSFSDLNNRTMGSTTERSGQSSARLEVVRASSDRPRWTIWRDGELCEETEQAGYALFHMQWELNRLFLEQWPTTLHAAAVELDGRVAILCGASMSGKTTLAGWLAVHGWRYLADEVVALTDELKAVPFHRPLGLRHDGPLQEWIQWPPQIDRTVGEYELLIPAGALGAGLSSPDPASAALIVFPQFKPGSPTTMRAISQPESLARMCSSSPGLAEHGGPVLERLAALARTAISVDLVTTDLAHVAMVLEELIRRPPN